jgi:beta-lactamase superfamily II metal-dependent hydrolase
MVEIDIIPASTETKGADSILIRFGTFSYDENVLNNQKVILIDGGYEDTSEKIIGHLNKYYHTKTINLLICTHPDSDHINGLVKFLENKTIKVEKALIHNPWQYKYSINRKSSDYRTTPNSISVKLESSLSSLDDLLSELEKRKTDIKSPFAGDSEFDGIVKILGPEKSFYIKQVTMFPNMPDYKAPYDNYDAKIVNYNSNMYHFLDDAETSARNLSSVILLFEFEGFRVLFTGDAGKEALTNAIEFAKQNNIDLNNLNYMQIPHHGSIKNLNEEIINKINSNHYFVSAPPKSEDHPSKLLLNYFQVILKKNVYHVSKNGLCLSKKSPTRNWSNANNAPVFDKVQILIKK